MWGGALATAGDVVFYGTLDGWFKAVDARNGTVLWKFKVGSGVVGNPIDVHRARRQAVHRGLRRHRRRHGTAHRRRRGRESAVRRARARDDAARSRAVDELGRDAVRVLAVMQRNRMPMMR